MLSVLYVRFRDVGIIWTVLAQVLFYATPILYPMSIVPSTYRHLLLINPLTPIFIELQRLVIEPGAESATEVAGGAAGLLPALFVYLAVCVLGAWIFNRDAPRIAEEL
jgi:ABC-2 type transport system permease protein